MGEKRQARGRWQQTRDSKHKASILQKYLREVIKEKSISFYLMETFKKGNYLQKVWNKYCKPNQIEENINLKLTINENSEDILFNSDIKKNLNPNKAFCIDHHRKNT